MISEKEMERYFDIVMSAVRELKKKYQGFDIAYFEFFFLIAVLFFRDSDTDICIFETGLGGRLDAVNVFEKPVMCIITQIGLDHTAILGDDLESIAREKCGIIKRDTPLVCIEPEEESVKKIGMRIWTHSDVSEILSQLLESGKIIKGKILWKNRLTISPQHRRQLPLLHHLHLPQEQAPQQVQVQP